MNLKNTLIAGLSLIFFCISLKLHARHIVGGEITYRCLGSGNYEITLLVYRDCLSNTTLDNASQNSVQGGITIYRGEDKTPFARITLPTPSLKNIDPNTGDPCLGLPLSSLCLERGYYVMRLSDYNINLPASDESYYIVYQRCCRNATINNIVDPSMTGATYFVELTPMAQATCNSSPVFNNFPQVLICVNEQLFFDHSAYDIDGDSLVYEMCSPLNGGGQGNGNGFNSPSPDPDKYPPYDDIYFRLPFYNIIDPLGQTAGMKLDSFTGKLTAVPKVSGQFVVGICVKEYRQGVLLSSIRRDFQFNVTMCEPLVVAVLEGSKQSNVYKYDACGKLNFIINNLSNPTFVNGYQLKLDREDAVISLTGTKDILITFPESGVYKGYMILNPEEICTDTAFFEINAVDVLAKFETDKVCDVKPFNFNNLSYSQYGIKSYLWDFGDGTSSQEKNPGHQYDNAGSYWTELTVEDEYGCVVKYQDTLHYYPTTYRPVIKPPFIQSCPPGVVNARLEGNNYDVTTYQWKIGNYEYQCDSNCVITIYEDGVYDLKISTLLPGGCNTDTIFENFLTVFPKPDAKIFSSSTVLDTKHNFLTFEDASEASLRRTWTLNNEVISMDLMDDISLPDTGAYHLDLIIQDKNACSDTSSLVLQVSPFIEISFPNTITSNTPGEENNYFRIFTNEYVHFIKEMSVFDRNGNVVFKVNNLRPADEQAKWDGTFNGRSLQSGVYVFLAEIQLYNNEIRRVSGDITLIK